MRDDRRVAVVWVAPQPDAPLRDFAPTASSAPGDLAFVMRDLFVRNPYGILCRVVRVDALGWVREIERASGRRREIRLSDVVAIVRRAHLERVPPLPARAMRQTAARRFLAGFLTAARREELAAMGRAP